MHSLSAAPQTDWGLIKLGRFCLIALLLSMLSSAAANAQAGAAPSGGFASPAVIVVGFVGGFVRSDDQRHLEVQMIERLAKDRPAVRAVVFQNRHRAEAHKEILRWLDTDGDGRLSGREKRNARIILMGHSWGGSAAIQLAKELNASGIPVLLTVQLDSVNRVTGDDCVIPANVAQALNFYQTRGLVHGCRTVRPMDASRTKILGNLEFEYTAQPAGCSSYSWFNRHILKTHNAMDCDPHVWSQVEMEIRTQVRNVAGTQQESGVAGGS
jgi:pimeloyl-ACP methyl ester carboxylesterase